MKYNMKNTIILTLTLFSFLNIFGQNIPKYKDESVSLEVENGVGIKRTLNFRLNQKDYDVIKSSEILKKWKETTFNEPKNKSYIELHKGWDDVIFFLESELVGSLMMLKYIKLKNGKSLDLIEGSKNFIYTSENNGIRISYTFKSQNDLGNYLIKDCLRTIDYKNDNIKSDDFIM